MSREWRRRLCLAIIAVCLCGALEEEGNWLCKDCTKTPNAIPCPDQAVDMYRFAKQDFTIGGWLSPSCEDTGAVNTYHTAGFNTLLCSTEGNASQVDKCLAVAKELELRVHLSAYAGDFSPWGDQTGGHYWFDQGGMHVAVDPALIPFCLIACVLHTAAVQRCPLPCELPLATRCLCNCS